MSAEPIVITGMGWVTPLGCDVGSVWTKLLAGQSAIGPVTRFDASTFATNFAAEVKNFAIEDFIDDPDRLASLQHAGINTRFALAAAAQAWAQSGLGDRNGRNPHPSLRPERVGLYFGSGEGVLDYEAFVGTNLAGWDDEAGDLNMRAWAEAACSRMDVHREMQQEPHIALAHLAATFGCRGPAFNCMTACAASTQAVGEAFEILRRGDAEVMLAGGTHTMIHPLGMTGFIRLTAMSKRRDDPSTASRPFDRTRDGFVMGEGAGVLVLERLSHALARGAEPLAEVGGYGSSADAFRITDIQPDGRGGALAMEKALRQAGIDPREPDAAGRAPVQYVSAHGTGTQENDAIETAAVKRVFGPHAGKVCFSSVKSMLGHLIQAAGAVELMTCVQAIRTGFVPPTINLQHPDPACDLDYVPNEARDLREAGGVDVCISNGFGFGGQNDAVLVRRYTGE